MPVSSLLTFSILLFLLGPALARHSHVIPLPSSANLDPSAITWDPIAQHFLVGSRHRPLISSVSDAGLVQTLIIPSDPPTLGASSVSALAVDASRRRLIAVFSSPAAISSYDLRSPKPHSLIFSSPLPDPSASIAGAAVDLATGTAFVATSSGDIFSVDLGGKISTLAQVSGGIRGLAHVSTGHLLVLEKGSGGILKVDAEDGVVKTVLVSSAEARAAEAVAVSSDGAAVMAGGAAARWVKSGDGWAEAAVYDEFKVEEGDKITGVAVREGRRAYVLVEEAEEGQNGKRGRIEEVEWEKEGEGEMVWAMVLVGLGLAYFAFWRFQMRKLVSGINKKRA